MKRAVLVIAIASLGACGDFPRDSAGTAARVRGSTYRVGMIAGAPASKAQEEFLAAVSRRSEGQPRLVRGAGEVLLRQLEQGDLDLVIGTFDEKTPWEKRTTLSRPFHRPGPGFQSRAAIRNGEHRWAMIVDAAVAGTVSGEAR